MTRDFSEFDFTVKESAALSEEERGELLRLFELNYRQANPAFLERSLRTLRHVAMAYHDGVAVGFGAAETRVMDLPRLPKQVVSLMGISCIAAEFRRRGLFGKLELLAVEQQTPVGTHVEYQLFLRVLRGKRLIRLARNVRSHLLGQNGGHHDEDNQENQEHVDQGSDVDFGE